MVPFWDCSNNGSRPRWWRPTTARGATRAIDGEKKNWDTGNPTNAGDSSGFVSRQQVVEILGYSNNYYFRGLAGGAGILQIEAWKANNLLELFRASER